MGLPVETGDFLKVLKGLATIPGEAEVHSPGGRTQREFLGVAGGWCEMEHLAMFSGG